MIDTCYKHIKIRFILLGGNWRANNKDNPLGYNVGISNIVDLPPTEEVSDNELETIDDSNEEFAQSNYKNFSPDPNNSTNPSLNIPIDQYNLSNTFSNQKEPTASNLHEIVNNSISDSSTQLDKRQNRPSNFDTPKVSAFSPHSPVSSPDL